MSILFPMMSFSSPCGVENMICAVCQCSALFSGGISPVNNVNFSSGSSSVFRNVFRCCSANGFVGAKISIFDCGYCLSLCAVSNTAIPVFPIPVGSTTSVFLIAAVASIVSWYSLGVNPLSIFFFNFRLYLIVFRNYSVRIIFFACIQYPASIPASRNSEINLRFAHIPPNMNPRKNATMKRNTGMLSFFLYLYQTLPNKRPVRKHTVYSVNGLPENNAMNNPANRNNSAAISGQSSMKFVSSILQFSLHEYEVYEPDCYA